MKHSSIATEVIAIAERADGNAEIGTAWLETKAFQMHDPIGTVMDWARAVRCNGRLILTIPDEE